MKSMTVEQSMNPVLQIKSLCVNLQLLQFHADFIINPNFQKKSCQYLHKRLKYSKLKSKVKKDRIV